MREDPLWIDVSALMKSGQMGLGKLVASLSSNPANAELLPAYIGRLSLILGVLDKDFHVEEVTGADKTLDIVVEIFNAVNSGGTKLSKGDLALAKICAGWPDARTQMKARLATWSKAGYDFNLDWLLRSVNTALTGEAKFLYLHDQSAADVNDGLKRATKHIETCLNLIAGRLGLDHARVFFGRFAVPVIVRYLDQKGSALTEVERDKLLFWFAQAGMWGRYSGSTKSFLDKDLEALEGADGGLDKLLEQLRLWHGGLRVEPGHFTGWSLGARFYPVLYMLTRMGAARDWGTGIPLKSGLLGKMSALEVHHIFPKAQLYKRNVPRSQVNAIANFCFLTKDTNLNIRDKLPEVYFPQIEEKHPGALASQWIPMDTALWQIDRYADFLEARKELLAAEANRRFAELLHGDDRWIADSVAVVAAPQVAGGVTSAEEEAELEAINQWATAQGFAEGHLAYDHSDQETGAQLAIFDLAWPQGLQEELTEPVAVLLNESQETIGLANAAGFRCFTRAAAFKDYVNRELLGQMAA